MIIGCSKTTNPDAPQTPSSVVSNKPGTSKPEISKPETSKPSTADTASKSVYPEVTWTAYVDLEMVEVIELGTDHEEFSQAMVEMNSDIQTFVFDRITNYEELLIESDHNTTNYIGGINVWAYSITNEHYIQIYNTVFEYPTYATAGDLFGFVYDIANDDYITMDEFLDANGMTINEVRDEIESVYATSSPSDEIGSINVKTFHMMEGPDGAYEYGYLFEMEVTPMGADEPFKGFYMYNPFTIDIMELNADCLFDPYSIDVYDNPLHCQEGWDYYYNSQWSGEYSTGEIDNGDTMLSGYDILQGDYYYEGDPVAAFFHFRGTDYVDAYYGDGAYETSYVLERLEDVPIYEEGSDPYHEVRFEVFDVDSGVRVFQIVMLDAMPGVFELYDIDGQLIGEYYNINI
jgi:hypothetical protein